MATHVEWLTAASLLLNEQAYRCDQYSKVVSNAVKHAFGKRGADTISISLAMVAADRAELVIRDNGPGFTPTGQESGMGSRLTRAFAQQLGNDYAYASDNGTRFAIRFAATRSAGET